MESLSSKLAEYGKRYKSPTVKKQLAKRRGPRKVGEAVGRALAPAFIAPGSALALGPLVLATKSKRMVGKSPFLQGVKKTFDRSTDKITKSIKRIVGRKTASRDMPSFLKQDRSNKVKEIYRALKRDHPKIPAEMKARIAARQGRPGKQKQGPPYRAPIRSEYKE